MRTDALLALLITACAAPGPWSETVTATARQHVEAFGLVVVKIELVTPGDRDADGRTFARVKTTSPEASPWRTVDLMCDREDCRARKLIDKAGYLKREGVRIRDEVVEEAVDALKDIAVEKAIEAVTGGS